MSDCHGTSTALVDRDPAGAGVMPMVAVVGSPNSGKTTLFNALAGLNSKVANYPGVTVTRQEALITTGVDKAGADAGDDAGASDRNGASSGASGGTSGGNADRVGKVIVADLPGTYSLDPKSPDEEVVADALNGRLEGVAAPDGIIIVADATTLARSLLFVGEVLALERPTVLVLTMTDELAARGGSVDIERLSQALGIEVIGIIGHRGIGVGDVRRLLGHLPTWSTPIVPPPADPVERASWADSIAESAVVFPQPDSRSARIDSVLLHPVWGTIVFFVSMLVFFQTIFTVAAPLQDLIDGWFGSLAEATTQLLPGWLGAFVGEGIVAGVGGVLVFVPQIALLFLLISLMEKVGYLSRAALLADRVMGVFGLEGRSFVAMLSSFACAVPGIMATRTIPDARTRLATMMAAPLMTCSARLPVYTLLVAAFVPNERILGPFNAQGVVMFGLYLLGAVSGLVYAGVLNLIAGIRSSGTFVMELPPYRIPTFRSVAIATWQGVSGFLRKAGTIILLSSMVLWLLLNVPSTDAPADLEPAAAASYSMERSVAGRLGVALEPVTEPLGFDWQVNVALIGSLAAREVFVSTLAITTAAEDEDSLPDRLSAMEDSNGRKVFDGPTVAALLVFFVYALQCLSTIAILRRETNSWRWPAIAFGSMLAIAYVAAYIARVITQAVM